MDDVFPELTMIRTQSLGTFVAACFGAVLKRLDVVALLLLMICMFDYGLATSHAPITRTELNTLDESWWVDLVFQASHGRWSGRDFAFTYGPLWQFLGGILPRAAGVSAGSVLKLLFLFPCWSSFCFLFLTARLLLPHVEPWRRAVFLIMMAVFWIPLDVRIGIAIFSFAAFVRLLDDLPASTLQLLLRSFCASGLVVASFLISGDAGGMTAVALVSVGAVALVAYWRTDRRGRILRFIAYAAASMVVCVLLVNTWAGGPFQFRFWISSLQIISAYRWLMATSITRESAIRLAWTLAACGVIFVAAWFMRESKSDRITMRSLFLWSGALFAGAAIQKGIVRSDWGHLVQAAAPALAVTALILFGYRNLRRRYLTDVATLAAVALTLLCSGPTSVFAWPGPKRILRPAPPFPTCPPGTYYLDQVCFLQREYATFGVAAEYIRENSGPQDPIAVFPYENIFGVFSQRRVSAGVLQNYAIGGEYLTNLQLSTLERERPPLAVYCLDDVVSWPVDGIPNFQRNAPVWLYLQRHYAVETEPAFGVLVLRRNDDRAGRLRTVTHSLLGAAGPSRELSLALDPSRWAPENDFLRLRLVAKYSPLWKIAKPAPVRITLQLADGTSKTARLALEPDRASEIWVYPWAEVNLKYYFRADSREWKPSGRPLPAVRSVGLRAERLDPATIMPNSIQLESLDGIELSQIAR
jgi:hypothetical protein